jgi:2,5-diamino-6-(ribosylamino)-4(3H)-pyrimidinone 5'-phosphate reductase
MTFLHRGDVTAPDELPQRTRKLVIRPTHRMAVRPRVIINAAMSVDGKIALSDGSPTRISNEEDIRRVHQLRSEVDAILVGIGTVLKDDPKLTVNPNFARGPNPLRVVIDSNGRTPSGAHVLDGTAPTLIVTSEQCDREFPNAQVLRAGQDGVDLQILLGDLAKRGIKTVLVEGGSTVIWSFLRDGLADELKLFIGSQVVGGRTAPSLAGGKGAFSLDDAPRLRLQRLDRLGDGVLLEYAVVR